MLDTPPFDRAKILVAGDNFGCGSSREQAVWAIADFGIRCVIAPSFGEIFYANCFKNGVLPIVMDRLAHATRDGAPRLRDSRLTVDLEARTVSVARRRANCASTSTPIARRMILLGLDEIGDILADDQSDIAAFEARQRQRSALARSRLTAGSTFCADRETWRCP